MNDFNTNARHGSISQPAETDLGLRDFMVGTYRYMAMAMAVTAGVAWFSAPIVSGTPALAQALSSPIMSVIVILVIMGGFGAIGAKLSSMSKGGVLTFLFGFAAFMGFLMSLTVLYYPSLILAKVFFMTVALFGALSLFGYTTRTDLMPYLKYAAIGFAVFVVYLVASQFIPAIAPTGMMETGVMAIGLVLISVMTAGKTQALKRIYYAYAGDAAMAGKISAYGAATLLLAFINMFQILMNLFGRE